MKVLILIDADNFDKGFINLCKRKNCFRHVDYYKLNLFVLNYLRNNPQYKNSNLIHMRTYYYTGRFTDQLIQRMETTLKKENDKDSKSKLNEYLEKTKRNQKIQEEFFKRAKNYYYFELRTKPLQFSPTKKTIFQKGVDVQLAVDLVDFTHKNTFDAVALLSGDIDLAESIKTAKNMGKQIVVFGDRSVTAEEIKKSVDMFIDIGRFSENQLNEFSHSPN